MEVEVAAAAAADAVVAEVEAEEKAEASIWRVSGAETGEAGGDARVQVRCKENSRIIMGGKVPPTFQGHIRS